MTNSVKFFPHNCACPTMDPETEATRAAYLLAEALKQASSKAPFTQPTSTQMKALEELSELFVDLTTKKSQQIKADKPRVKQK